MRIQISSYHYVFINNIPLLVYSIFWCYILLENDSNRKRGSQMFLLITHRHWACGDNNEEII